MMKLKRWVAPLLALVFCLYAFPVYASPSTPSSTSETAAFAPDRILVVLKSSYSFVNKSWTAEDFASIGAKSITDLTYIHTTNGDIFYELLGQSGKSFHQILEIKLSQSTESAVENTLDVLSQDSRVLSASANYYYTPDATLNDPYYNGDQASMQTVYRQIGAEAAWALTKGSNNVKVGIIDSGICDHEDLRDNVTQGYDFYNQSTVTDDDAIGHGTHIAGIIGAVGNNGIGSIGVAPRVSLVPLQVTMYPDAMRYDSSAIIKAVTHACEQNLDILNCSFGSTSYDAALYHALDMFSGLIVCSAGNHGADLDATPRYPAAFDLPHILSVASVSSDDTLASNSAYGITTVDIAAPGVDIWSTSPDGYAMQSGTSFSAAFVSGAAALLLSYNPHLKAEDLKTVLTDSAEKIPALAAKTACGGRLNIHKALLSVLQGNYQNTVSSRLSVGGNIPLSVLQIKVTYDPAVLRLRNVVFHESITPCAIFEYRTGEVYLNIYPHEPTVFSFAPARCNFTNLRAVPLGENAVSVELIGARDANGEDVTPTISARQAILGDIDNSGRVTLSDAMRTFLAVNGRVRPTQQEAFAMDINRDDTLSAADALLAFHYINGSTNSFLTT